MPFCISTIGFKSQMQPYLNKTKPIGLNGSLKRAATNVCLGQENSSHFSTYPTHPLAPRRLTQISTLTQPPAGVALPSTPTLLLIFGVRKTKPKNTQGQVFIFLEPRNNLVRLRPENKTNQRPGFEPSLLNLFRVIDHSTYVLRMSTNLCIYFNYPDKTIGFKLLPSTQSVVLNFS